MGLLTKAASPRTRITINIIIHINTRNQTTTTTTTTTTTHNTTTNNNKYINNTNKDKLTTIVIIAARLSPAASPSRGRDARDVGVVNNRPSNTTSHGIYIYIYTHTYVCINVCMIKSLNV